MVRGVTAVVFLSFAEKVEFLNAPVVLGMVSVVAVVVVVVVIDSTSNHNMGIIFYS